MSPPRGDGGVKPLPAPTAGLATKPKRWTMSAPTPVAAVDPGHKHEAEYQQADDGNDSDGMSEAVEFDDMGRGTKKRKGPVPVVPGSEADIESGRDGADRNPPRSAREDNDNGASAPVMFRLLPRSPSAQAAAQRRALFQKRKAALVALYCDAQAAFDASVEAQKPTRPKKSGEVSPTKTPPPARVNGTKPPLPDAATFERLLPALEDLAVWPPDAPGWREGDDAARPVPRRTFERWRTGFAQRKRQRTDRVRVRRHGWAPEGSFELDIATDASARTRSRARDRLALVRLAEQLRSVILSTNKLPTVQETVTPPPTPAVASPPTPTPPAPPAKKKGKKKKKRTQLANEGNPHHVDKYRPSRPIPTSNPYEPWPWHAALLFPPSMRLLAARPGGKDVRPGEDEYICVSCQYALFYGSEKLRKRAIRQRRAELARREKVKARAKEAASGNLSRRPSQDDDDDEYDDEDEYEDDDDQDPCEGRCSCGRALPQTEDPKPPDKDPPALSQA